MKHLLPALAILAWMVAGPIGCSKSKERSAWQDNRAIGARIEPLGGEDDLMVTSDGSVTEVAPVGTGLMGRTGARSHTIRRGDTLWAIARATYGSGTHWRDIQAANPGINPRRLLVGRHLQLP